MNWTYSIKHKLMASGVLFILCLLVLVSNYLDRTHINHVKNSIATLYEDRLIAEGYILKMTGTIYQIRELLHSDMSEGIKTNNVSNLIDSFSITYNIYMKTRLTTSEQTAARELAKNYKQIEQNISTGDHARFTANALENLRQLSSIQIDESRLIIKEAEAEYANIKASSQFAYIVTIVILVVLQALVFSSRTLLPVKHPQDHLLN